RPYRSKRHRPCDVCRRRKHGCFLDDEPPCRVCRSLGAECTFNDAPRKRPAHPRVQPHSPPSPTSLHSTEPPPGLGAIQDEISNNRPSPFATNQLHQLRAPPLIRSDSNRGDNEPEGLAVSQQPVCSLGDSGRGTPTQYMVLSGEMDPYLLRHMRFTDQGNCNFGHFQYRNLSQQMSDSETRLVPGHIPVQFLISGAISEKPSAEASHGSLSSLVSPEMGVRLVSLFLRYVFPSLPVLSRSGLKVRPGTLIPTVEALETLSPYLLAAVYAAAEPFRRYDPVLCVALAETVYPAAALWRFAYQGILREMQTSNLQVLQAILIYTQRAIDDSTAATVDNPGDWPLLGSAISLATRLGLHLDCLIWPIPPWERRLRRRLWWIVYSEAVWRSLLLGLPRSIPTEDWAVSTLDETDFEIDNIDFPQEETTRHAPGMPGPCPFCHLGHDFKYLASLSVIAHDVHGAFYTISANQKVASDFTASFAVGQRLLKKLQEWNRRLPPTLSTENQCDVERRPYFHSGSAAHLKLAFVTLEVLVHRAIHRPLGASSSFKPANLRTQHEYDDAASGNNVVDILGETYPDLPHFIQDSIDLAKRALAFTQRLGVYDRNSFAYSWASACFAAISNFNLLLLVQAPNFQVAGEMVTVLIRWIMILRDQSITFTFIRLGLLRLDSLLWLGLEKSFRLPSHVKAVLQN
ncbi:hypothetical protein GQ53DRAFT_592026, partial [Thozetella sp. PMI_491]